MGAWGWQDPVNTLTDDVQAGQVWIRSNQNWPHSLIVVTVNRGEFGCIYTCLAVDDRDTQLFELDLNYFRYAATTRIV